MAGFDTLDEEQSVPVNPETASLSAPAAGEVDNAMADEIATDEPSGRAQQGQDRTRYPEKNAAQPQGPKTTEANRKMTTSGSSDQGTQ